VGSRATRCAAAGGQERVGESRAWRSLSWIRATPVRHRTLDAPARQAAAPPQATLEGLHGGHAALTDWRGKIVVLNVWASWCEPCRSEMASLEQLHRALDPKQAIVVGLSVDEDRNLAREYLLRSGISFANFSDGDTHVSRNALGVNGLPQTLILNRDGSVRERIVGPRDWSDARLATRLGLPLQRAAAASAPAAAPG